MDPDLVALLDREAVQATIVRLVQGVDELNWDAVQEEFSG
jgi:hypothetical protein